MEIELRAYVYAIWCSVNAYYALESNQRRAHTLNAYCVRNYPFEIFN